MVYESIRKKPHVNKRPLARKRIVIQTLLSHSKLERKKFHAAQPLSQLELSTMR